SRNVILLAPRRIVIERDDIVAFKEQALAEMGADEAGAAGHEDHCSFGPSVAVSAVSVMYRIGSRLPTFAIAFGTLGRMTFITHVVSAQAQVAASCLCANSFPSRNARISSTRCSTLSCEHGSISRSSIN